MDIGSAKLEDRRRGFEKAYEISALSPFMVERWVSDWGMRLGVGGGDECTYGRERDLDGGGTFFDGHCFR